MDILKEIQQAEAAAADIEREYRVKAESLLAGVASRIASEKALKESGLENELIDLRSASAKRISREGESLKTKAAELRDSLKKRAAVNEKAAIEIVLRKLGL